MVSANGSEAHAELSGAIYLMSEEIQVLHEILQELRILNARLVPQEQAEPDELDIEAISRLLQLIQISTKGLSFTSSEVLDHAEILHDRDESELWDAVIQAVGQMNARMLGSLLADIEGRSIEGLTVRRLKNSRDGVRWRILKM
jgi:hypothetical protein